MGLQIEDGRGSGRSAGVTPEGNLTTMATSVSEEHETSRLYGLSFIANTTTTAKTLTVVSGNTYNLIYLANTSSTRIMVVQTINSSSNAAGGVFTVVKNPTVGTLSNYNVFTPVNLNFSSGLLAEATCYSWNEVGTAGITGITGGTTVAAFITGAAPLPLAVEGAFIIPQNTSIVVQYTSTGATETSACIRFYYDQPA